MKQILFAAALTLASLLAFAQNRLPHGASCPGATNLRRAPVSCRAQAATRTKAACASIATWVIDLRTRPCIRKKCAVDVS